MQTYSVEIFLMATNFVWLVLQETQKRMNVLFEFRIKNWVRFWLSNLKLYYVLGVSPSLVSRYCEDYWFWSTWGPYIQNFRRLWPKLKLSCWLPQLNLDSQQSRVRTTSILVRAFWNLKLKVLEYSRNCNLHNTLIPLALKNPESPDVCMS